VEGIIAIIMIFGMPVFIVGIRSWFKYRTAVHERERQLPSPEEKKRIERLEADRALLEERVQNLETIVCSVDLELNARLNRLAAQQSRIALPPATTPDAAGSAPTATSPAPLSPTALATAHEASSGALAPGATLLGRFQIERLIGSGGMGAVYLASDRQIGEQVALKVIARGLADDPAVADRFRREASAARRITHPNVIRIHDLGEDAGLMFLSMEYFPGRTLAAIVAARRQLPLGDATPILRQVCDALRAAHAAGVVHRDLKPQNILVNDRGEVRVIDFGLAKAAAQRSLTATGLILGTPDYMAPEQVRGQPVDHRADIYSLGAMTYHLLCGRPPFVAESPIAVGFLHCHEAPAPLTAHVPTVPAEVEAAVLRCLAKSPGERWNSVEELAAALLPP
jgi:serine/threonine-protein kinase